MEALSPFYFISKYDNNDFFIYKEDGRKHCRIFHLCPDHLPQPVSGGKQVEAELCQAQHSLGKQPLP